MRTVFHLEHLEPCPWLPPAETPQTAAAMRVFGRDRGPAFYLGAFTCAQSLWLQGLPGQAMLQLNRAFSAELTGEERELAAWPLPYAAMTWIMTNAAGEHFIGNPRRHFQHLATRMVEPNRELRTWRAWACWDLARLVRPADPADLRQIEEEGIVEPETAAIFQQLERLGLPGEASLWFAVVEGSQR